MDKRLLHIIGSGNTIQKNLTELEVSTRHHGRLVMLCRYTFVDLCERLKTNKIDLPDFNMNISHAEIGIWMKEPYMKLYDKTGKDLILYQFSDNTIKIIYLYLKNKLVSLQCN